MKHRLVDHGVGLGICIVLVVSQPCIPLVAYGLDVRNADEANEIVTLEVGGDDVGLAHEVGIDPITEDVRHKVDAANAQREG